MKSCVDLERFLYDINFKSEFVLRLIQPIAYRLLIFKIVAFHPVSKLLSLFPDFHRLPEISEPLFNHLWVEDPAKTFLRALECLITVLNYFEVHFRLLDLFFKTQVIILHCLSLQLSEVCGLCVLRAWLFGKQVEHLCHVVLHDCLFLACLQKLGKFFLCNVALINFLIVCERHWIVE